MYCVCNMQVVFSTDYSERALIKYNLIKSWETGIVPSFLLLPGPEGKPVQSQVFAAAVLGDSRPAATWSISRSERGLKFIATIVRATLEIAWKTEITSAPRLARCQNSPAYVQSARRIRHVIYSKALIGQRRIIIVCDWLVELVTYGHVATLWSALWCSYERLGPFQTVLENGRAVECGTVVR